MIFRFGVVILCSIAFVVLGSAQETETTINKSLIPLQANELSKFVPPGWKIEEKLTGDLNGDSLLDFALKLIENKVALSLSTTDWVSRAGSCKIDTDLLEYTL